MTTPFYQLLYISSASETLNEDALLELLAKSQARNARRNITGLLLHSDGNIIQIIEGKEADVEALFAKIEHDSRHRGVIVLSRKSVAKRDFPEYKMGFRRTRPETLELIIPGFSSYIDNAEIPNNELDGVSRLVSVFLKTFARNTGLRTEN